MHWDAPEFIEAIRLIEKFFPESKGIVSPEQGVNWENFLTAMRCTEYHVDYSCDPFRTPEDPDLGLAAKGGMEGTDDEIYLRLLSHSGSTPSGRAVVVPDPLGRNQWSTDERLPFVCHSRNVPNRFQELDSIFEGTSNTIIVFESGEAFLIDHDDRFHWAKSRIRRWVEE